MQRNKDEANAKQFASLLRALREEASLTISEGNHDTAVWGEFGVPSISVARLLADRIDLRGKTAYIGTDLDRAGEEKRRKVEACLQERHPGTKVNTTVVPRMLKILGVRCVEEMRRPAADLMRRAEGIGERSVKGEF